MSSASELWSWVYEALGEETAVELIRAAHAVPLEEVKMRWHSSPVPEKKAKGASA